MKKKTGNFTNIFFIFFTSVSVILIGTGYGFAEKWLANIFILLLTILTFLSVKFNWDWAFNIILIFNSILATVGILIGAPSFLMVAGVATALASWELSNTEKQYQEIYSHAQSVIYEKNRIRLLLISIGSGIILAELVLFVQFQLPFIIVFLLAIIILFCFFQISRLLDQVNK
ncbi:MAG: hypothetical protein IH585_05435 [Anaerolineaceae bacterium]|nr:hypothetical protein [Anaerolineaceae bacterium]